MRKTKLKLPLFLLKLIKDYKYFLSKKQPFTPEQIKELKTLFVTLYRSRKNLERLNSISENFKDLLIVGDTHGELQSTLRVIKPFLEEKVGALLFLGDYIEEGEDSLINIVLLLALAVAWPDRVLLLRGNHEEFNTNTTYSFSNTLKKIYSKEKDNKLIEGYFKDMFNIMSLAAITAQSSICMHGGLPKNFVDLEILNKIPRPHDLIEKISNGKDSKSYRSIVDQIRWNDPDDEMQEAPMYKSYHGNKLYSKKEVLKFLSHNKLKRIIRSHESRRGSFEIMFGGRLYHILSMESDTTDSVSQHGYYFGNVKKGYILHEEPKGALLLRDLDFNIIKKLK
jgi:predicted phosphodiesterase